MINALYMYLLKSKTTLEGFFLKSESVADSFLIHETIIMQEVEF